MRLASWDDERIYTVPLQNGGIGVCLYIAEANFDFPQTLYASECHQRWIPRGSDTSVCPRLWLGAVGVLCQALEVHKNSVGIIIIIIWKSKKGVRATTTLFPCANSRLNLGTLSHFAPWKKPIHGLELFHFATVSPVLPTCSNTLDRSHHFEPGTFLNRRHYCDVWYLGRNVFAKLILQCDILYLPAKLWQIVRIMAVSYFSKRIV